ncbi:MAG: HlyD family efflux transporter periplasmic adaptor subunit [Verrucomicrobia bacterium]|nr:HlyD family efflux transporter periplasmic adaptor subunit [Verrucomicrobiota bacterium]
MKAESKTQSETDSPAVQSDPDRRPPKDCQVPSRWHSILVLTLADLDVVWRSWLCRGFLLASALITVLELKSLQAHQQAASQMLEVIYTTYIVVWMHGIVFIAGGALSREQDCLADGILSRGITRGEYMSGKLAARSLAILLLIGLVLLPSSFWAIRQDQLIRTEDGFVASHARNTRIEAWDPKKIFAEANGTIAEAPFKLGDSVRTGDALAQLDDRPLFDALENERRGEENARNDVTNARRRFEEAKRAVAQAEDAMTRAERALIGKDLMSKTEQADRETELRSRKRDLKNAQNQVGIAQDAIKTAERAVENAQARVRDARKRLGYATITAPISGYVTEVPVQIGQPVNVGTHLFTIARLDEYEVRVPIYKYEEFKRLKAGLPAYVKVEATEFTGAIERLSATTTPDRWGRDSNYAFVRFKGNGSLGLLGLNADVRLALPPPEERPTKVTTLFNALTGRGADDAKSRTASVTTGWMLIGFAKVVGCAAMLVTLTLLASALFRSALIAILSVIGLYHISNLLFDFAGLPDLSYLEMVRNMDKVLGGIASPVDELTSLAWLFGIATVFGIMAMSVFISRDPMR